MRENRLTPVPESPDTEASGKPPAERAKAQLERYTRYWPMIISQTTIFNMQAVSRTTAFFHTLHSCSPHITRLIYFFNGLCDLCVHCMCVTVYVLIVCVIQVVPLANLIVKESLSEEDLLTCQKTVYNLVDMERKNDPLPISTVGSRGKGPKR